MSIFNALTKAGLAKKVLDEAKKPENQAKAKSFLAKAQTKMNERKQRPAR